MGGIPFYWRLSGFYLFYFALLGVLVPYWAVYLRDQGYVAAQIGVLMALPQVTKLVAPNLWGWLADQSGRRMSIIRFGNLAAALAFSTVFLADQFWTMALVLVVFSFFWNAVLAQFEVVTLDTLGHRANRYSHVRLWGSVGFIVAVFFMGQALDHVSASLIPWAILAMLWLLWAATLTLPKEAAPASHHESRSGLLAILRRRDVQLFLLCAFLMQMSHGPYYAFFTLYLDQLGWPRGWTGFLWALGVLAEVAVFLVMHRLLVHTTLERIIQLSLLLAAVRWLLLAALADSLPALLLAQLLHAASFGTFHAACIPWVQRAFRGGHAGQGQAFYSSIGFGAGWAVGAMLTGWFWDRLAGDTFYVAAGVALLATLVSLALKTSTPGDAVAAGPGKH